MTSRIVSFFKYFQRANAGAISAGPNSWATVGLWRRFFELKEQEEQEEQERIVQILEEIYYINSSRPVELEHAVKARREMVSEYYRGLKKSNNNNLNAVQSQYRHESSNSNSDIGNSTSRDMNGSSWNGETREANLDIPVGNFHVSIAQ